MEMEGVSTMDLCGNGRSLWTARKALLMKDCLIGVPTLKASHVGSLDRNTFSKSIVKQNSLMLSIQIVNGFDDFLRELATLAISSSVLRPVM